MASQYRHHRAAMSLHSIGVILTLIFTTAVTDARAGTVATVAGTGAWGFSGDGGPAVDAILNNPFGIATAPDGTIYFADNGNFRIRSISPAGVITTVAGNGSIGDSGDGGPATSATMTGVLSIALDPAANALYFADIDNNRIRRVDLTTGIIAPFAGLGIFAAGAGGDGGPALNAEFMLPRGVAVDGAGDVYIADTINCRIRKVDVSADIIQTVAGNGTCAVAGDGGSATTASLYVPAHIALDSTGNLYILELNVNIIRRVDAATGIITTVAGGGTTVPGFGPATDMNLGNASDLATDASGNLYIGNATGQIYKVDMSTGLLTVFAGAGSPGFGGDGGPAISALFRQIGGLAFTAVGELIVGDADNNRVRAIAPDPVVVNPDLIITPATTQALLDAVTDIEGSVILVEMDGRTILLIPNLARVGLDVAVQGNDQLLTIDLGALASVGGNIDIGGNLVLTTLDLGALTDVAGNLNIADNPNLSAVLISGVTRIGGNLSIIGSAATVISLPALTDVTGSIDVTGNNAASSIDLGALTTVGGGVDVTGNTAATSVGLGSLVSAGGGVNVTGNAEATSVDLGSLQTVGGGVNVTGNSSATSLNLGQLATAEGDVNVTGNTAATSVGLGSLVSAGGGVNVTGNTEATSVDLGSLQNAGGGVNVTGNSSATSLNLGQLTTAEGDVNVTGNTAATSVGLGSLTTAGGGVDVAGNTTATSVDLGSLTSAGGGVNVTGNTEATTVDLGSLESAGGVDVTANGPGTSVDIGALTTVTGDVSVESSGTGSFVAGPADVSGNTSLTLDGYSAVTATTAAGTTDVSNATPDAVMHLHIQAATFTTPVAFTATRLDPLTLVPESGTATGGAATVDPIAAYQFAFDIPTLGHEAALSFDVVLAGLDAATQQALLDGLAAGTATLATKGDAVGSTYQAFPLCSGTTVPTVDGCVLVEMFDANGNPITVGTPASVRFSNAVGHFSTWAVAIVTPQGSDGDDDEGEGEDDGEQCPTPSTDLCLDETGYVTEFTDTFTRRYGKPGMNKIRFSAQSDAGILVVRNHGCTSAVAELNHKRVVRQKAVKRNASCFTRDVTLKDKNMLAIELRGKPGCSIEVALVTPKACVSQSKDSKDSHDNKP